MPIEGPLVSGLIVNDVIWTWAFIDGPSSAHPHGYVFNLTVEVVFIPSGSQTWQAGKSPWPKWSFIVWKINCKRWIFHCHIWLPAGIYIYMCIYIWLYVYIGVYHQPIPFPFFVAIIQFWPNSYGCTLMANLLRVICLWGNLLRTVGTAPWQAIYVRAQGTDLEKAQPIYCSPCSNYLFIYWQTWKPVRWTVYIYIFV